MVRPARGQARESWLRGEPAIGPDMLFGDPDAVAPWHLRGGILYLGGILALVLAAAVTDSSSGTAGLVLAAHVAGTAAVCGALVATARHRHRWSLLLWPVASCSAISALNHVVPAASGLVLGFVVLSFLFIGLSQPRHWGLPFVIPAAALFVQVIDLDARMTAVRLAISALVWVLCCEVPAKLLSELRAKQGELARLATTDNLTGLLNRTTLAGRVERVGGAGAVALIDLDHFKAYNDARGHLAGDAVLVEFADTLRSNVRPDDAVFRFGGEEFVVVMANITPEESVDVLERVSAAWIARAHGLTFSAGVVSGADDSLAAADAMLYQAKRAGRDRIVVQNLADPPSADSQVGAF